jgi:hypothetical protein
MRIVGIAQGTRPGDPYPLEPATKDDAMRVGISSNHPDVKDPRQERAG